MGKYTDMVGTELNDLSEWNDRHDVVGLTPDHWISPIDFTPFGWINKGAKALLAARTGYRLGKRGLTTFGKAAYKEARRHAASAGSSLLGKGARKYRGSIQSSSSSLSSYQQNGGGGDTPSPEKALASGFLGNQSYKQATERSYPKHQAMRCRPGFVEKRVNGKLMCVRSTRK